MPPRTPDPQRMRRSAWIFFASIVLPSLGLAWLAIRSVRDQQVILEHQQVIISQNITDALAKSVQDQMDAIRADFVKTTAGLLAQSASPESLALDFNHKLCAAWPLAEIGFAVSLDGRILSPRPDEDADARIFRDENGPFLANRENVEVYSNSLLNEKMQATQNAAAVFGLNALVAQNGPPSAPAADGLAAGSLPVPTLVLQQQQAQVARSAATALADKKAAPVLDDEQLQREKSPLRVLGGAAYAAGSGTEHEQPVGKISGGTSTTAPAPAPGAPASTNAALFEDKAAAQLPHAMPVPPGNEYEFDSSAASTGQLSGQMHAITPAAAAKDNSGPPPPAHAPLTGSTVTSAPVAAAMPSSDAAANVDALSTGGVAGEKPAHSIDALSSTTTALAPVVTTPAEAEPASLEADLVERTKSRVLNIQRQVIPQQMLARDSAPISNTVPADSDFRRLVGTDTSGELARFLENKLRLIVWSHAAADAPIVFGAQLDQGRLVEALQAALKIPEIDIRTSYDRVSTNYCTAILDDTGHPVALSRPGFVADWKHPFVATEIGEVLPHWEAALYQVDPRQISRAARTVQWTLGSIVLLLVAAIVAGGSLIGADVRRQVRLAQQKTDFVSNVSHELKTPLTSIRMFADLLAEKRVPDADKQATYLRIIAAEASRLTRLINNVLDFARLDRGAKDAAPGEHRPCDLVEALRDVIDTCGPHLEAAGIAFHHEIEADALPISGDRDALAQIVLNLVSNAEKYGGGDILVRARRQETAAGALGCIDVLDRGAGIPAKEVRTIFEPFQRLDDSLASGIPGSGLGLTLARRMARAHGGDVAYSPRAGGGSCFTLTIPLEKTVA